ncbi:hypothetical protein LCGC14_1465700 [marine sediment metagenome]|uniref:IS1 family transposase n=1 Tax=marine sediment metagenome TaxID=412755 RepID=A0A0F9LUG2_9ZZZZ
MANRMSTEKRNGILRLLVEGNSIRSIARILRTNIPTVLRQLKWAGKHCREVMDAHFQNLTLEHLECDEIWTFCLKKQARLTVKERAERADIGDIYLWTALDQKTRLIPSFMLGKRSGDMARRFMVDLASRLTFPKPHESDAHAFQQAIFQIITQISTDGFAAYPEAVDLAFGPYVKYGTIVKDYRNATEPGRYAPPEMVGTERRGVFGIREHEERTICTSHVERNNLTIRTFMKRFTRLALGFSKKLENLEAAVNLHMAHYNFCWRPGKMRVTPAMAAKVTDRLWSFDDLLAA